MQMNNCYTLTITTTGERCVKLELLDERFSIQEVVVWLEGGGAKGFNPIHDHPVDAADWAGIIKHDGRDVARYTISDLEESGEVEGVYRNFDYEIENAETQEVE